MWRPCASRTAYSLTSSISLVRWLTTSTGWSYSDAPGGAAVDVATGSSDGDRRSVQVCPSHQRLAPLPAGSGYHPAGGGDCVTRGTVVAGPAAGPPPRARWTAPLLCQTRRRGGAVGRRGAGAGRGGRAGAGAVARRAGRRPLGRRQRGRVGGAAPRGRPAGGARLRRRPVADRPRRGRRRPGRAGPGGDPRRGVGRGRHAARRRGGA